MYILASLLPVSLLLGSFSLSIIKLSSTDSNLGVSSSISFCLSPSSRYLLTLSPAQKRPLSALILFFIVFDMGSSGIQLSFKMSSSIIIVFPSCVSCYTIVQQLTPRCQDYSVWAPNLIFPLPWSCRQRDKQDLLVCCRASLCSWSLRISARRHFVVGWKLARLIPG